MVPWTRRYVVALVTREHLAPDDAWDEAMTALIRAACYFRPGAGSFASYAETAVRRGLWRYCRRATTRAARAALATGLPTAPYAVSAETSAAVCELAARYFSGEGVDTATLRARRNAAARSPFARAAAALAADFVLPPRAPSQHGQISGTR